MDTTALLGAAAQGDQSAWNSIVDRYQSLLWSVVRSYRLSDSDAQDVIQTTWLRLVEHLGSLRDAEALAGWLGTTVRRECLQLFRRSGRISTTVPSRSSSIQWVPSSSVGARSDEAASVDRVVMDRTSARGCGNPCGCIGA